MNKGELWTVASKENAEFIRNSWGFSNRVTFKQVKTLALTYEKPFKNLHTCLSSFLLGWHLSSVSLWGLKLYCITLRLPYNFSAYEFIFSHENCTLSFSQTLSNFFLVAFFHLCCIEFNINSLIYWIDPVLDSWYWTAMGKEQVSCPQF